MINHLIFGQNLSAIALFTVVYIGHSVVHCVWRNTSGFQTHSQHKSFLLVKALNV